MKGLMLKGGTVVTASDQFVADVYCEDGIIKAVEGRDGVAVQTGCSSLRQAYGRLLASLGLDRDDMFRFPRQPPTQLNQTTPRRPAVRTRARTTGR